MRISVGDAMSAYILPQIIYDLYRKAPAVRIELIASNEISDLRRRDARWGIRDLDDLTALATDHALLLDRVIDMPANNFTLLFRRQSS